MIPSKDLLVLYLAAACLVFSASVSVCRAATYGNTSPFTTQSSHSRDYVLGVQVAIPQSLQLASFGLMYGHPASSPLTSSAILGLYDSSGSGGYPGTLIAETGVVNVSTIATYTFNFTTTPTIAPGTYWMMALYANPATPRMDISNRSSLVAYFSQPFGAGMPASAPTSLNYNGQNFNYWINGNGIPEPGSLCLLASAGFVGLLGFRRRWWVRWVR